MFKYKKAIILMLAASLLFALLGGGELPYFLFYTAALLIIISFFWTRSVAKKLTISQRIREEYVYVGDEIEIKTMAYNESILPLPCVEIKNEMIKDMTGKIPSNNVLSLMSFDSRSVFEKVKLKYRGYYNFGPVNVSVSDIFGLFTWNRVIKCEGALSVYPKVTNLESFGSRPMQLFGTVTTKMRANEDYSSISEIRKYYPGDSFKKIHWKVSARKGSLHVKNYEMSGSAETHIFLNLYKNDYVDLYRADIEEKAVECAASIIHYMLLRNINTGLFTNGERVIYTRGRDLKEFKKFMEELITVKSNGSVPVEEILETRSRLLTRGSSIILITSGLNDRLADKILLLSEAGYDVITIYISVEGSNEEQLRAFNNYIENSSITLHKIGINDDVRASLEG